MNYKSSCRNYKTEFIKLQEKNKIFFITIGKGLEELDCHCEIFQLSF
jgi:hypothetical protein